MIPAVRRWSALFAVILVAVFAAQAGTAADGQRYRDEVFASATVTSNIAYGQAVDEHGEMETLRLDLYEPAGDTETARPAFVWIHGGGFTGGDKGDGLDATIATRFAKRGYVTVSINYRLRPGHYFVEGDPELTDAVLDAQHDAQAAVRWLRADAATYRIDAGRIGIGGYSAGAITSLQTGYNSSDPGDSGNPGYPSTVLAVIDVSGGMDTTLMDHGEPPVLIVHGTVDTRVAYHNALDIVARAQEVGVPYEFHPLDGVGHGVWGPFTEPIIGWMSDFLYRYVAPQPAVGGVAEAPEALAANGKRYRDETFGSVDVTSNIAYGQAPDEDGEMETLRLDLYQPSGDTETARPAFIWIHGGGFSSGDKADDIEELVGREFARRGYVVASINYRMREGEFYSFGAGDPRLPEVIADAQHDAQAAVRWLRANASAYGIDTAHVAVGGFSAGAVAALSVCYQSSDPGESGNPGYPSTVSACVDISGDMDVSLMEAGEPATLVVHGTADTWIPYQGALDIVARAEEVGVTTEFHPIEGAGHVVWFDDTEKVIGWMSNFLYRYVAPRPADGGTAEASASGSSSGIDAREVAILATLCVAGLLLVAGAWGVYSVRRR